MTTSAHLPTAPDGSGPAAPSHESPEAAAADAGKGASARPSRAFVIWLLVISIGATACVVAANWWLDPLGITGRQTRFTSTQNHVVRTAKLDLMDDLPAAPDVLLLGSSRSMKLDPIVVEEVSGKSAFNAGVSGARTKDSYLFAAYADELWPKQFPHLVIGLTNDMFHRTDSKGLDRRLKRHERSDLEPSEATRSNVDMITQLASLSTTKASLRAARTVVPEQGFDTLLHPEGSSGIEALQGASNERGREASLERGMQVFVPGSPRINALPTNRRVHVQMTTFINAAYKVDSAFTGVDPQGLVYFRALLKMANARGDEPTIWITPYHPRARAMLPPEYDVRDAKFRKVLDQLRDEGLKFTVLDYADPATFQGNDEQWFDGIHMQEPNTRRVIEQLERDGGL